MKKIHYLALSLCAMTGFGAAAFAQAPPPPNSMLRADGPPPSDFELRSHGWHCPTPVREQRRGPAALLRGLDLTADQRGKLRATLESAHDQGQMMFEKMRADRKALRRTSPLDPSFDAQVAAVKADTDARLQANSDMKKAVFSILTPGQQAQLMARLERRARSPERRFEDRAPGFQGAAPRS